MIYVPSCFIVLENPTNDMYSNETQANYTFKNCNPLIAT